MNFQLRIYFCEVIVDPEIPNQYPNLYLSSTGYTISLTTILLLCYYIHYNSIIAFNDLNNTERTNSSSSNNKAFNSKYVATERTNNNIKQKKNPEHSSNHALQLIA
jgi:hypothetical protein